MFLYCAFVTCFNVVFAFTLTKNVDILMIMMMMMMMMISKKSKSALITIIYYCSWCFAVHDIAFCLVSFYCLLFCNFAVWQRSLFFRCLHHCFLIFLRLCRESPCKFLNNIHLQLTLSVPVTPNGVTEIKTYL